MKPDKDFGNSYPDYGFVMEAGDAYDNICIQSLKVTNHKNNQNDFCLNKFPFKLCSKFLMRNSLGLDSFIGISP